MKKSRYSFSEKNSFLPDNQVPCSLLIYKSNLKQFQVLLLSVEDLILKLFCGGVYFFATLMKLSKGTFAVNFP